MGGRTVECAPLFSEQAQFVGVVADQHILGLLIVVQHNLVIFAPDARLFLATKGGMGVIVVHPDAPGPVAKIGLGVDLAASADQMRAALPNGVDVVFQSISVWQIGSLVGFSGTGYPPLLP